MATIPKSIPRTIVYYGSVYQKWKGQLSRIKAMTKIITSTDR